MNMKLNLKKMLKMRGLSLALVTTAIVTSLTGCSEKADCEISGEHLHKYISDESYIRYIDKEYLNYEGYKRTDDYIDVTDEELALSQFEDKNNLLKIEDNLDLILKQQEKNVDYLEYEYSYEARQPISHFSRVGRITTVYYTYRNVTRYNWTKDPNHEDLTGETRFIHYVYTAYKIQKNDKGKYVLVESDEVDDITTIMEEYPYIKEAYYKEVEMLPYMEMYYKAKKEILDFKERIESYELSSEEIDSLTLTK